MGINAGSGKGILAYSLEFQGGTATTVEFNEDMSPFFVKIKKERLYSETSRYFIKELSDDEKVGQLFFMPQCVYVCSGKGSAVIFLL